MFLDRQDSDFEALETAFCGQPIQLSRVFAAIRDEQEPPSLRTRVIKLNPVR